MKKILFILILLTYSFSSSQETDIYKTTLNELKKSTETLNSWINVTSKENFYIGINIDLIVENPKLDFCIDIKTTIEKNEKLISILEKHNLIDKLYLDIEDEYQDLQSDKKYGLKEPKMTINLKFLGQSTDFFDDVYILIFDRKQAKEILDEISNLFDYEYCFRKMRKKI